ncbi:hypothetical protein [Polluticoccus soli]|uniref:hypothetical protein n=1 Tax=Polluticoccus soli TaxID=3034150 RepID=UPI0023E3156A|nr:hypothetical protein [Flavipsychrobacter sp. JY13-12]
MRITLILAIACLGFVACNKEYTCECTTVGFSDSLRSFPVNAVKEKQAKEKCTKYEADVNTVNLGTTNPAIACSIN